MQASSRCLPGSLCCLSPRYEVERLSPLQPALALGRDRLRASVPSCSGVTSLLPHRSSVFRHKNSLFLHVGNLIKNTGKNRGISASKTARSDLEQLEFPVFSREAGKSETETGSLKTASTAYNSFLFRRGSKTCVCRRLPKTGFWQVQIGSMH